MSSEAMSEIQAGVGEGPQLAAVQRLLGGDGGVVRVSVGDDVVELPPSLVGLLALGAERLGGGDAVVVVSEEAEVSPAQAAKLLGVSRQYVDRLVANGVLPTRRLPHSRYRKIPAHAVLAHKVDKDTKRRGIASILDAADEAGLPY